MISCKTAIAIYLGAALGMAQTINIRGVVRDSADAAVSGAVVRLEVANISTMTGSDGRFTLTDVSTQTQRKVKSGTIPASPIQHKRGKITITLSGNAPVTMSVYDVGGRQIYSTKQTYGSGTHAIPAPLRSAGIYLLKVTIGNAAYFFKSSPSGAFSPVHNTASGGRSTLARHARAAAGIAEIMLVFKEGQIQYRESIQTYDTNDMVIKMIPNAENVTDADGNVYQSVRIGNQIWTVENLRTTKYNDGTAIQQVAAPGVDEQSPGWRNLTTGAYCFYDNNTANESGYGALYNWFAVRTGKLAPKGWHVPSDAEWDTLQNYLVANGYNWDGTPSGNKIAKSMAAKMAWCITTEPGTIGNNLCKNNATGFSALPGGCRDGIGVFHDQGCIGNWWSATENADALAYLRSLADSSLHRDFTNEENGLSVRLLRN